HESFKLVLHRVSLTFQMRQLIFIFCRFAPTPRYSFFRRQLILLLLRVVGAWSASRLNSLFMLSRSLPHRDTASSGCSYFCSSCKPLGAWSASSPITRKTRALGTPARDLILICRWLLRGWGRHEVWRFRHGTSGAFPQARASLHRALPP